MPFILGSDASGIIVDIGNKILNWSIGDEVVIQPGVYCGRCKFCIQKKENYCIKYGIIGETENGTNVEYFLANNKNIFLKPKHLSYEEAASMQLVFMTAYQMLITCAKLKKEETVLIYGGSSGIGAAAIQIAKYKGANVITTVGSNSKKQFAKNMGADFVVLHNDKQLFDNINKIVSNNGIDIIFEHFGKLTWNISLKLMNRGSRLVTCGATTGSKVKIDLKHLFYKQQSIIGSTMSDISSFKKVMKLIHENKFKPFVDKIFSYYDVIKAHQYLEERKNNGKVVISYSDNV